MMASQRLLAGLVLLLPHGISVHARGEDAPSPSPEAIRRAVEDALPLLDVASAGSAERRKCFTCHSQGLPVLAMVDAQKRGFEIDVENLDRQIAHTAAHLKRGRGSYLKGVGQGGKADTAGSALWALDAAGHERSEITDAVVGFLLGWNDETPYWSAQSKRPPSEGSRFTSTFLALRGLGAFGSDGVSEAIQTRRDAARDWLVETGAVTTEDRVFRLRAMEEAGVDAPLVAGAARELLDDQRDDGGWSQLTGSDSDAYATGSALVALHRTGQFGPDSAAYRRGLKFLLGTQRDDGSWHVVSRSSPIQEYFESGFPHGVDQFISCAGTAWATLALLQALPLEPD